MYQTKTENSGNSPNAINVQLCGEKLDKKDTFGKSDPFLKIYSNNRLVYRSETIRKTTNPQWKSFTLTMDSVGGPNSFVHIECFDFDDDGGHDLIGVCDVDVRKLGETGFSAELHNANKKGGLLKKASSFSGTLKVVSGSFCFVPLSPPPQAFLLQCSASKLEAKDGVGKKSDPFLLITKGKEIVTKTEFIKQTLSPEWNPFTISLSDVGSLQTIVNVQCFDWDSDGSNDLIGSFSCPLEELLYPDVVFPLVNPDKKKPMYKNSGLLQVRSCKATEPPFQTLPPAFSFKCSALKLPVSLIGKTDPFFKVYSLPTSSTSFRPVLIHKSPVIKNDRNPSWPAMELPTSAFQNKLNTEVFVEVWDWESKGTHSKLGETRINLREMLLPTPYFSLIDNGKNTGSFYVESAKPIAADQLAPLPVAFSLQCSASKLDRKDGPLSKSDPFFEIWKGRNMLYRSEFLKQNLSPTWQACVIKIEETEGIESEIEIRCFDWDGTGAHDLIGKASVSVRECSFGEMQVALINPEKTGNMGYKSSGSFSFDIVTPIFDPRSLPPSGFPIAPAYKISCCANKIQKRGITSTPAPYFEVSVPLSSPVNRYFEPYNSVCLYRSEIVKGTANPEWAPFTINLQDIVGSIPPSPSTSFDIKCFDWSDKGHHKLLGSRRFTFKDLAFKTITVPLLNSNSQDEEDSNGGFSILSIEPISAPIVPQWQQTGVPPALRLTFNGVSLDALDTMGKSDPFFDVTVLGANNQPLKLYRSEVIKSTLNPEWKEFDIPWTPIGGLDSPIKITCYDWDKTGGHDVIGVSILTLRLLLMGSFVHPLYKSASGKSGGGLKVVDCKPLEYFSSPYSILAAAYKVKFSAKKLDAKDLVGSDPFFDIVCKPPNFTKPIKLYRSEVIKKNLNPEWAPFELTTSGVGGLDTVFTINCYDWDIDGSHDLIGSVTTTLRDFTFGAFDVALINPEKANKSGYESSGALCIEEFTPLANASVKPLYPVYECHCSALKIEKMDGGPLGKADPFFEVYVTPPGSLVPVKVYRSEVCRKTLSPKWNPFRIDVELYGGFDQFMKIDCYDWDPDGVHDLIGSLETTLREFTFGPTQIALRNPEKMRDSGYQSSGGFSFDKFVPLSVAIYNIPPALAFRVTASASKIKSDDLIRKADPFFEVFARIQGYPKPVKIYRSEVIKKETNPEWAPFILSVAEVGGLDAVFEVHCWDWDKDGGHDIVGKTTCTLREWLIGAITVPLLHQSKSGGGFTVSSLEPLAFVPPKSPLAPAYNIFCSGMKLEAKDSGINAKSDPFFEVAIEIPGAAKPIKLYRSEAVMKDLNPVWKPFQLCTADVNGLDGLFTITVYDWDRDGTHDIIGRNTVNLRELLLGPVQLALRDPERERDSSYQSSGAFSVDGLVALPSAAPKAPIAPAYLVKCSAKKLAKKDSGPLGKSDPYFEVICQPPGYYHPIKLYRSEVIKQNLNPDWVAFELNTSSIGSIDTYFTINCFDWDKDGAHDLIGSLSTTLREFTFGPVQLPLIDPEKAGRGSYESSGGFGVDEFIPLTGEVVRPVAPAYRVYTSAMKLDKKDPGPTGKSDPFFVISVRYPNGYEAKLYRSEVVMKDLNPKWKPFDINIEDVGGMDGLFTIECYDWDADGGHDLIGKVTATFREFTFGSVQLALLDPEKTGSRGYSSSGAFSVDQIEPLATPIVRPFYPAYKLNTGGTKLAKRGLVGKSDAFFEIFAIVQDKRYRLYRSEVINGDDSPIWAPVDLSVTELGGFDVPFAIKCFNWDKAGAHLYIGECILTLRECLLGNITSALLDESKQSKGGFTIFSCIPESNPPTRPPPSNAYEIHCSGMNLDSKNGPMQKSDPYFEISAQPPGYTNPIKVYRSPVIQQTLNPKWEPFALNVAELGGVDANFTIDCYDWEKDGANQLIGSLTTTIRDFMFGPVQIALVDPAKVGKLNYKSSGAFSVDLLVSLPSAPSKPPVAPAYFVECSAQKLARKELIGKTDAFFEVLCHPPGYLAPIKLHRSEVIRDSLSPSWQGFQLSTAAVGGLDTPFTINCMHWDKEGGHQFIGCIKTTLREFTLGPLQLPLVSAKSASKDKKGHKKTRGAFWVNTFNPLESDQIKYIAPAYSITASGIKLDKKDNLLGKSDPFFVVSSSATGKLYRSETVTQDLNPKWKSFSINIRDVGGLDSPFTISVFDWDADGVHSLIGEFTTTFREFTFGSYQFGLVNSKKKDNIGYKTSGAFSIDEVAPLAYEVARPLAPAYRIHCHAAKLDRKDVLGKSDGFFEVYSSQVGPNGKLKKLYRSEFIKQELAPDWVPFDLSVADAGGIDSPLIFKCLDWDESGAHDYIGTVECSLRECLFGNLTLPLINAGKVGRIGYKSSGGFSIPTCEPLAFPPMQAPPAAAYLLSFAASNVDKKNALASSADPFFEISVSRPSMPDRPIKLYRSPVINNSVNPSWGSFALNTQEVGGMDGEFTISFFDWEKNGAHVNIGKHTTTLREFTFGPFQYPITNVEKAGRFGYSSSGALSINGFAPLIVAPPSFPITPAYWLKCSATKLDKKDLLGKSDPYFEISITPQGYTRPIKLHRSEVIKNSTDADWAGFQIPFGPIGGWDTLFSVKCFDWDADGVHELIGECNASLRELSLGSVQFALINPDKAGRIGYTSSGSFSFDDFQPLAEHSIKPIAPAYTIHVSGVKLEKKDGPLGASDPFFVLSRNRTKLYRSEAIKQDLNPKWAPFNINIRDLNGIDELFTIDCYDWDADGVHSLIGSLTTTFREFTFGPVQLALINPRKVGRIGYSSSGAFSVNQVDPLRSEIPPPIIAPGYRLFCSGTKLPSKDLTLKSDPFFEVSVSSVATGGKLRKIYRSEIVKQSLTPEWQPVDLSVEDPMGGIDNPFTVKFYDWDKDGGHDYIGCVSLTLRECRLGNLTVPIINEAKASRIGYVSSGGFTVSKCDALLIPPQKQPIAPTYLLNCSSAKLDAKDGLVDKTSDPFVEISVKPPGYPFRIKLHRSAVQHKTLNPIWEPFALSVADVGGWDAELTVTCFDWDKDGSHDLIGTLTTNLREFSLGPVSLALINPSKIGRPLYQSSGSFAVNDFIPLSTPPPSFMLAPAYRIRCSAEKLDRKDGPLAKSDPFFVVTAKPPGFTKTITLHRSPVIKQTLSPEWPAFELPTSVFGTLDTLFTISCYDWDADGGHDLIGEFSTTLRELTFGPVRLALINPSKVGRLGYKTSGGFSIDEFSPVTLQDLTPVPPAFRISAGGKKIDGKLPLVRPDPFFVLSRVEKNGVHTKLYRSEAAKQDSSPLWQPFEVNLSDLGGLDGNIVVDCYDWNGLGFHELIGSVTTTFREFTFGPYEFGLINAKKRAKNALYQTSGAFSLQDVQPLAQEIAKPLAPSYKLEVHASKLDSKDLNLSSDPYIEVVSLNGAKPRKVFRSEVIKKNLNPEWKPFDLSVEELGGIDKPFIIRCYDWDEDGGHDIIGTVQTTIRECLFGNLTLPLAKGENATANTQSSAGGISIVKCTPLFYPIARPYVAPAYLLHFSGRKLDAKDAGPTGKSDPFFEITVKPVGANKPIKLYRSSAQKDTLNPTWEPCELSVYDIGGIDGEFTINCYDHNKDGAHALIGSVTTTLWEFTLGPVQLALINPAKVGRPLYETSGAFSIDQLIPLPTASLKPSAAPAYKVKCLANNVDRKDGLLGESDPFFEILCQPPGYTQKIKLYRSEVVKKNRSPEWVPFELSTSAVGGLDIPLTINCYDWDKDGGHDLIGSLTTTLRDFSFGSMASALVNPAKLGRPGYRSSGAFIVDYFVPIPISSLQPLSPSYKVNIRGVKLDSKDTLGKSDPFFVVSHNKVPLYRSEVVKQDLNPVWTAFDINITDFYGLDSLFDIECYDWDADGVHDLIGKLTTTFREFTFGPFDFGLINKNKEGRIGYTTSGALHVEISPIPQLPPKWASPAYKLHCQATKLACRDILARKLDPFFEVYVGSKKVHRSEIVKQSVDPTWKPFDIIVGDIGGLDQKLTIKCFDWDKNENKEYVGSLDTSLRECTLGSITIPLRDGTSSSSSGGFTISKCEPLSVLPPSSTQFAPAYDIRCKGNLPSKVVGSTNAFFEVVVKSTNIKVYRSQVQHDTREPLWEQPCILRFGDIGGLDGEIIFNCYDFDKDGSHSLIGSHTTTLREFTFGLPAKLPLINQEKIGSFGYSNSGSLSVIEFIPLPTAPSVAPLPPAFEVKCSAQKLDRKDALGKSDPYFEVSYYPQGYPAPLKLHRSEVIEKELNPSFAPFQLSTAAINGLDVPFTVTCYDWDKDGGHDLIGSLSTTLRELSLGPVLLPLINPNKVGRLGYHSSGGFYFEYAQPLPVDKVLVYAPAYQFNFSAQKLDRKDGPLGKSDPFFVIKKQFTGYTEPSSLYRSEVIKESLSPTWKPAALNTATLGLDEPFTVEVFDWDKDGIHDLIGKLTTTLREFTLGSVQLPLKNPKLEGRIGYQSSGAFSLDSITPLAAPIARSLAPAYQLHCSANALDRKDVLGTSDPYFEISINPPGTRPIVLYRSEYISKNLSPSWQPVEIALLDIGNPYFPITVTVYDHDKDGSHDLIGKCTLTLDECILGSLTLPLINPSKNKKSGYKSSGSFTVSQTQELPVSTKPALAPAYRLSCYASDLDNKDKILVGKTDPFFEIVAGNGFRVHQSEDINNSANPEWAPFVIDLQTIGGLDTIFGVSVFDRDRTDSDEVVGRFEATLRDILAGNFSVALVNPYKTRIGYKSSGAFNIAAIPVYEGIKLPEYNAFKVSFDFEWGRKKKTASSIRIEAKPNGVSEFVLVSYAPFASLIASIRLEDVRSPYDPIRIHALGYNPIETTLHELLFPKPTFHLTSSKKGKYHGLLRVTHVENFASPVSTSFSISLSATNLDAMDGLGEKSDPFLVIKSPLGAVLHTTDVIPQTLSPTWNPFVLNIHQLGLLLDHPLLIECVDYDPDGTHDLIGIVTEVSLRTLFVMQTEGSFPIINPYKKQQMARYTNSGQLFVKVHMV